MIDSVKRSGGSPRDIEDRTFRFAVRILKLVDALPRSVANDVIARQVARSGSSMGANVEEAQGSHSRAEFARRMGIARSEARETHYWLRLVGEVSGLRRERLAPIVDEAEQLVKILTTIVKRTRISA